MGAIIVGLTCGQTHVLTRLSSPELADAGRVRLGRYP